MILLGIASILLFFITYTLGLISTKAINKFFQVHVIVTYVDIFFLGLITSFVYFNCVSLLLPTNYLALIPLLIISLCFFFKNKLAHTFFQKIKNAAKFYFAKENIFFTIPILVLFFVCWIIPPGNADSPEYQYSAIRWYEKYKVIPGLANIHGRLSFNPANFILSAPYSFTGIAGQALYPLNGVIAILLYSWLIKKIVFYRSYLYSLILLIIGITLFRVILINISSPSSDLLSNVLVFYIGLRCYELLKNGKKDIAEYLPLILMIIFAITAKLTILFLLLLIPYLLWGVIKKDNLNISKKLFIAAIAIWVPWLIRNTIMSGYLFFPVPHTNFFGVDWEVPKNVLNLDYIICRLGPHVGELSDLEGQQHLTFIEGVRVWFTHTLNISPWFILIFILTISSPFWWIFITLRKKKTKAPVFGLWCVMYICVWVWFLSSPEFRFAMAYLLLTLSLPLLELAGNTLLPQKILKITCTLLLNAAAAWYCITLLRKESTYKFTLADCWLYPLKDGNYFKNNDKSTFPFTYLRNGVKLYISDGNHHCVNTDLPCMSWYYGEIEMRGNTIEDGFRNVKDEVRKKFPFVH